MGQPPQEERRAAAEAFIESLTQLEQTLEAAESVDKLPLQKPSAPPDVVKQTPPLDSAHFSLSNFEDAIADLEQFIQSQQSSEP